MIMFSGEQYTLGIPIKRKVCDELNELILSIIKQEPTLGIDRDLMGKIDVTSSFHITLGVFHPSTFQTNRGLFKHIIHFLREHKKTYAELKSMFNGNCRIKGIGFAHKNKVVNNIKDADIIYAAVESSEVQTIRTKIHDLLRFSGIDDSHFTFTDPHITLFRKKGKKDVHGVTKPLRIPLNNFLDKSHIDFSFETVGFYGSSGKELTKFGPEVDGAPSKKFGKIITGILLEAREKAKAKGAMYKWGNLFRNPEYRSQAQDIKTTLMSGGPEALEEAYGKEFKEKILELLS